MAVRTVAYVGSYTYIGKSKGLTIFDVDVETGIFTKRKEIAVSNASYIRISEDNKFLYSVTDEGIVSFKILPDGDLEKINVASIRGMRGCFIELYEEKGFLFVAGYHDGKMTALRIREDGGVGEICDSFYDKGMGSVAERSTIPHISCVRMTPDKQYVCVVDLGIDQMKVFRLNPELGKLRLVDILRCDQNSAPRNIMFSPDGKYMYMISELKNEIWVYSYDNSTGFPQFELIQRISSLGKKHSNVNAAMRIRFSRGYNYVLCSNVGDNSAGVFEIDHETGLLTKVCVLPISGSYPKDVGMLPGEKYLYSINHEDGTITCFTMDYEKKCFSMHAKPVHVDQPNCCAVAELPIG